MRDHFFFGFLLEYALCKLDHMGKVGEGTIVIGHHGPGKFNRDSHAFTVIACAIINNHDAFDRGLDGRCVPPMSKIAATCTAEDLRQGI